MEDNKSKKKSVDDAGIRLAPTPIRGNDMNVLPPVRQDFIITPHIEINEKENELEKEEISSIKDYQPKKEDRSKRWKRGLRGKNIVVGSVMFIVTAFALLPYILGIFEVQANLPFKYIPTEFNAIHNFIEALKETASLGWTGDQMMSIWLKMIPDLLLIVGIIGLIVNLIKSTYAAFAAVKQVRFIVGALIYLLCVLAIFVVSLIGISPVGIEKIDFINDFINNCATNELFTLVVTSLGYFVVCIIINFVNRDKLGYLS